MATNTFQYKEYSIEVSPATIKIDKNKTTGKVFASIIYIRALNKDTFSGEFPYVVRDGQIHKTFLEVIDLIGTSKKVTIVNEPKVRELLDKIKK